jgi:SAM-dependent methyltransferase
MLVIPERFNKNAPDVRALGTQAQTGTWLIEYMCDRLGVRDLGQLDVLDFGCGCRFADAIINNSLPIKSYTGIDLDRDMIVYLLANITDQRLRFYHWNARNPNYNPSGFPMTSATSLPTGKRRFDLVCMFSVITHQVPQDAEILFRIFRRYIRPKGHMFFSVNL